MQCYKKAVLPLLFLLLVPLCASAQVPQLVPLNYKARYDIQVGGVGLGRLRVTSEENNFSYKFMVDTKTSGLGRIFAPLESVAQSSGTRADGQYIATIYHSHAAVDGNVKDRDALIRYDPSGAITERTRHPMDKPTYRPVVPVAEASSGYDPNTALLIARKQLRDAMANNQRETHVKTYDGSRLADMKLQVVSRASIEIMDKFVPAINTVLTRTPISGYTAKELNKFKDGDPVIHVYFSADERMVPLMITISLYFSDVKLVMTEYSEAK